MPHLNLQQNSKYYLISPSFASTMKDKNCCKQKKCS